MATHHIAAMLSPAWGHTVSYISVAIQMLQKDPTLVITIVQHNSAVAQMEAELQTWTYDSVRLRIVGVGDKVIAFGADWIKVASAQLTEGWLATLSKLVQGSEGWPTPHAIHEIIGPDCKVLLWFSCALASMSTQFNEYDFATIAQGIYTDETRREGRSLEAILEQVAAAWNGTDRLSGRIVKNPGMPDIYDYERRAYGAALPHGVAHVLVSGQKLAKIVDGHIVTSTSCFEPVGVPHYREFYQKRGQELFTVGLQAHESCWADAASDPPTNEIVRSFLDTAVSQYGPKSVLYISFGSLFFPVATPELVEALVHTLLDLEKPFPFIFALGGKTAALPKELIQRANSSGRGLICDFWVEQRAILHHRALGWFLTHGGFNSVSESLSGGIPLIIWPVTAEQPVNAALLSTGLEPVAFELMQIRTGPQRAPSLRGGPTPTGTVEDASAEFQATFEAAREPTGALLTANAINMAKALGEARAGEVSDELVRLASF